jgi:hypothetical protein
MPSSIVLRACGGLPPYEWTAEDPLTVTPSKGPAVTVTSGGGEFTDAYITFNTTAGACAETGCPSPSISGTPGLQMRIETCVGGVLTSGGCSVSFASGTTYNVDCGEVCTGTITINYAGSSCGTGACLASDYITGVTVSCGDIAGEVLQSEFLWDGSGVDTNEYLVSGGGSSIDGKLVTVMDAAGVEVTYEVNP